MRLEQGSHSCIQRAIDSYGALAILYSRHSKHYIKKPEVFEHVNRLLGQLVIWVIFFIDSVSNTQSITSSCYLFFNNFLKKSHMHYIYGYSHTLTFGCFIQIVFLTWGSNLLVNYWVSFVMKENSKGSSSWININELSKECCTGIIFFSIIKLNLRYWIML